jgi:hypothetical protein
MKVKLKVRAL